MKNSIGYLVLLFLTVTASIVLKQSSINAEPTIIPQQTYSISNPLATFSSPGSVSISGKFSAQDRNRDKSIDKTEIVDFNLKIEHNDLKVTCNLSELSDFKFSDFEEYIKRSSEIKKMTPSRERYDKIQRLKQLRRSLKLTCQRQGLRISLDSESNASNKLEIKTSNSSSAQQRQSFDFIIDLDLLK